MSTQTENVQINLKINGIDEFKTFKDLNGQLVAQRNAVFKMDKSDPGYTQAAERLQNLVGLHAEWRRQLLGARHEVEDLKKPFGEIMDIAIGSTLGNLAADGLQMAIGAMTSFVSESTAAYAEAEQGAAQLEAVIKSTGGVAGETKDNLDEMAGSLMDLTGIDDDVITKSESLLLTFTNIRGEIYDQTLPAIVDMTSALNKGNVSMETIQGTTVQVGKALNDPIKGLTALQKVGVSFTADQKNTVKSMVAMNDISGAQKIILAELNKEFGGVAEAMSDTETGAAQKFQTRIGNIQESIGALLTQGKGMIVDFFGPLVGWIERATATRLSDTLEKDRMSLAANVVQLQASNTSHETRLGIINKLKEQYPAYLGNIDAEKASNEDLLPVLGKINEALVLRIAFQKKSEGLTDAMQDEAEALNKLNDASEQFAQTVSAIIERANSKGLNIVLPKDLTDIRQADYLIKKLKENTSQGKGINVGLTIHDLEVSKQNLSGIKKIYDDAGSERQRMLDKQAAFAKKYGLNANGETKTMEDNNKTTYDAPTNGGSGGTDAKKLAAAKKAAEATKKVYEELDKDIAALDEDRLMTEMSKNQKEIEQEGHKYDVLIEKEQEFLKRKGVTDEQRTATAEKISKLENDKKAAQNAIAVKQEADMVDKIKELRTQLSGDLDVELQKEKGLINKFYDDQEKINADNPERLAILKKARAKDLADAEIRETARIKEETERIRAAGDNTEDLSYSDRLAKINKFYDDQIAALARKYSEEGKLTAEYQQLIGAVNANRDKDTAAEKKKKDAQTKDYAIQGAETVANAVFSIGANNRKRENDMKLQALDQQREKELSNKNLTEAQKKEINDRYDAKVKQEKLRAWKADQEASAKQAIISGLLGAAKALPNYVLAALAMGTGIANAIAIRAEKPPVFAKKGALIPNGPSHENGGINLINNSTGEQIAEMEGGEPIMILSKETARNNQALINELLYNSQFRNGARVSVNADLASQVIRPFRNGGVINEEQPGSGSAATNVPAVFSTKALEDKLDQKFNQLLDAWSEGIPFNYRYHVEETDKIQKLKNGVNS